MKTGGWQILPGDKGTNTFSGKEMEGVFGGGKRPLVGNGMVLGGWTAAGSLCQIGKALDANVILFRAIVNFANISAGKAGLFSEQARKGSTTLEVGYAEMDAIRSVAKGFVAVSNK